MLEIGTIKPERIKRGLINEHQYQFVLQLRSGAIVARSGNFSSSNLRQGIEETSALERFVNKLRADGWQVIEQEPDAWYSLLIARGPDDELNELSRDLFFRQQDSLSSRPNEMSVQKMWAITIVIVIALFFLCILLVLTAEVRIMPA